MKKIGLSMLASVFVMSVNAQLNAPGELTCTEEAVTFRASFSSGWHFSKPALGQQRVQVVVQDFTMPELFPLKTITPKIPEQQTFERSLSMFHFGQPISPAMPAKIPLDRYLMESCSTLKSTLTVSLGTSVEFVAAMRLRFCADPVAS